MPINIPNIQNLPFPSRYASLYRALHRVLLLNYLQTKLFSLGINKGNKLILSKLIFRFYGIFLNPVHMYDRSFLCDPRT